MEMCCAPAVESWVLKMRWLACESGTPASLASEASGEEAGMAGVSVVMEALRRLSGSGARPSVDDMAKALLSWWGVIVLEN